MFFITEFFSTNYDLKLVFLIRLAYLYALIMNLYLNTMSLKNYFKLIATTLVLFASLATGLSQGVVHINRNVFVGQTEQFTHPSGANTASITVNPKKGTCTVSGGTVTYQTAASAAGEYLDTFTVQYNIIKGVKYTDYVSYAVKVGNTFINAKTDYAFTNKNQDVIVDVLANDVVSHNKPFPVGLFLNSVSLSNNGTAIVANEKIKFTPDPNYVGLAYVSYVTCDDFYSNCKTATLNIQVNNTPQALNTNAAVSTSKDVAVNIMTPRDGFVASNAANGTVSFVENNAFRYKPNAGYTGADQIVFSNAALNMTHTVNIEVINKATGNQFAIDDVFFTAVNQPVTFDVLKNDRVINPLLALYSQSNSSQGTVSAPDPVTRKFTFTPANGFEGIAKFTYNLKNQGGTPTTNSVDEWATVNIVVSNQYPSKQVFELKTPVNTPLVLNYNIPITGWNFSITDSTQHGELKYHPNYSTLNFSGQHSVSGHNLMVYTPTTGFVGTEEFELLYSIGTKTRSVKFVVLVEPVTPTLPQYCIGDCVWAGDANNDGIVDIVDLLPVGYCQGENGFGRPNPSTGWYGQFANNWQQPLMPGTNMKYIDSDGNGEVDGTDVQAIDLHYNKVHNITPEKPVNFKAIPLSFQLLTPNPQIGDLVEVDVLMGSTGNPATDMSGFTMTFPFDSNVINYQSLQMSFYQNSWMTYNSPILALGKKHSGNQIDFGMVRTGGSAASGIGKVAKLSFVIDDDVNGFRDEDGIYQASLQMSGGKTMGSDGIMYDIAPQSLALPINLKKGRTGFDATKVITYPNPASSELNIYINGGYEMSSYQVYNLAGQQLQNVNATGKSTQINVSNLVTGIYFVKIISDGGVVTKKFEVVK